MRVASLILGVLGSVFGFLGALFAMVMGRVAGALGSLVGAQEAGEVEAMVFSAGVVALLLSILGLVGGVLALSRPKAAMWLQLIAGVGIILTSTLTVFVVAFIMLLAGAILAWLVMRQQRQATAQAGTGVEA